MKVKYWIGSDGSNPERIYFNEIDAMVSGYAYLDLFDEVGALVESLKLVENEYISQF